MDPGSEFLLQEFREALAQILNCVFIHLKPRVGYVNIGAYEVSEYKGFYIMVQCKLHRIITDTVRT